MKAIVDYTGFHKFSIVNLIEKLSVVALSRGEDLSEVHIFVNPTKPKWKYIYKKVEGHINRLINKMPNITISLSETINPVVDVLRLVEETQQTEPFFAVATNSVYLSNLIAERVPAEKFIIVVSQDIYDDQASTLEAMGINFLIVDLLTIYEEIIRTYFGMTAQEVRQARGHPPKQEIVQAIMEMVPTKMDEIIKVIKERFGVDESYIKMSLYFLIRQGILSAKIKTKENIKIKPGKQFRELSFQNGLTVSNTVSDTDG